MKKVFLGKKGIFDQLSGLGIGLVTLMITLAVSFLIMANVKANASVAADGNATAAVNTITSAAATIPGWVGIVVIVAIGAMILGLLGMFGGRSQQ